MSDRDLVQWLTGAAAGTGDGGGTDAAAAGDTGGADGAAGAGAAAGAAGGAGGIADRPSVDLLSVDRPPVVAIETVEGSVPLNDFEWPSKSVVIMMGGEGLGISKPVLKALRPGTLRL